MTEKNEGYKIPNDELEELKTKFLKVVIIFAKIFSNYFLVLKVFFLILNCLNHRPTQMVVVI
jgi:hypothetical protein